MSSRRFQIFTTLTCVLTLGLIGAALYFGRAESVNATRTANTLRGRPMMLDRLVMFDTADAFVQGELQSVAVVHDTPAIVRLDDQRLKTYPRYGAWISPVVQANFDFTELIPSWNATTPLETGLRLAVRVRDAGDGSWSPWMNIGRWGRINNASKDDSTTADRFDGGRVNEDNLVLDRPADAFQSRLELQSFDLNRMVNPSLRRLTVSYSGQAKSQAEFDALRTPVVVGAQWARDLHVPYRAQGDSPPALSSQICSATSTSMVMQFWGTSVPTIENACSIYDDQNDTFGNWGRAVARAGELGLDAWLTRFRDWDAVKAQIAQGQPVIASIKFKEGEFPSSVLKSSAGHLIVIRGFTPAGDAICNDPGKRSKGNGAIYKANELAKAWFENAGGVAYIIRKPASGGESQDSLTMK